MDIKLKCGCVLHSEKELRIENILTSFVKDWYPNFYYAIPKNRAKLVKNCADCLLKEIELQRALDKI